MNILKRILGNMEGKMEVHHLKKGDYATFQWNGRTFVGHVTATGSGQRLCHRVLVYWTEPEIHGEETAVMEDYDLCQMEGGISSLRKSTEKEKMRYCDEVEKYNRQKECGEEESREEIFEPAKMPCVKVVGKISLDGEESEVDMESVYLGEKARGTELPMYADMDVLCVQNGPHKGLAIGMVDEENGRMGYYVAYDLYGDRFCRANYREKDEERTWGDWPDGAVVTAAGETERMAMQYLMGEEQNRWIIQYKEELAAKREERLERERMEKERIAAENRRLAQEAAQRRREEAERAEKEKHRLTREAAQQRWMDEQRKNAEENDGVYLTCQEILERCHAIPYLTGEKQLQMFEGYPRIVLKKGSSKYIGCNMRCEFLKMVEQKIMGRAFNVYLIDRDAKRYAFRHLKGRGIKMAQTSDFMPMRSTLACVLITNDACGDIRTTLLQANRYDEQENYRLISLTGEEMDGDVNYAYRPNFEDYFHANVTQTFLEKRTMEHSSFRKITLRWTEATFAYLLCEKDAVDALERLVQMGKAKRELRPVNEHMPVMCFRHGETYADIFDRQRVPNGFCSVQTVNDVPCVVTYLAT